MRSSLRRCPKCGHYTTKDRCQCGEPTITAHPARFSPDDRYGEYRRRSIIQEYGENGKHNGKV